jgi:pyruvate dehydrogenase complex dehydrogenase (E1) component
MQAPRLTVPTLEAVSAMLERSEGREQSTTTVFVSLLSQLLRDSRIGKRIVPIVADEARTFGMQSLFRQVGIYASLGQLYEPRPRPATAPTPLRCCRSTSSIPCSASSESAISLGLRATRARAAS